VDQHPLVHTAVWVHQEDEGMQRVARGDGDGKVGYPIGSVGENLIFAAKEACYMAKLAKVAANGVVRKDGGDTGEMDGGNGVTGGPAVDEGAPAGRPRDAGNEAGKMTAALLGCEEGDEQQLGLWLWPDVGNLLDPDLENFVEKVVALLAVHGGFDHTQINEDSIG